MKLNRVYALALLCGVVGCADKSTSLMILISADPGATVSSVTVSVFDDFGLIARSPAETKPLPGALRMTGLSPRSGSKHLRVAAVGGGVRLVGGTWVMPSVNPSIVLSKNNPDADLDGVPDNLDDCPTVADPEQTRTAGQGLGDACLSPLADLGVPDLSTPDLSLPDLSMPDLSLPHLGMPDLMISPDLSPVPLCGNSGILFCDGFDAMNGAIDSHKWGVLTMNGTAHIDTTKAYKGHGSLRIDMDPLVGTAAGTNAWGLITETGTFAGPTPPTDIFIRAFINVPSTFAVNPQSFLVVETPDGSVQLDLQLDHGGVSIFNVLQGWGNPTQGIGPVTNIITPDMWVCVEWEVKIGPSNPVNVWVNDSLVTGLSGTPLNTTSTPAVGKISVGLIGYAGEGTTIPARTIWIDEVAIDSTQIGCDKLSM